MRILTSKLVVLCAFFLIAACGDDGGSNNGTTNNNTVNNGSGNNGSGNNGSSNNGSSNNGSSNNGSGELTISGETCEDIQFTACGGDVIGTWALEGGCVTPTELPYYSDCGADISVAISPMGSVTFADDGTFTVHDTKQFYFESNLTATLPKSCLGEGETCTDNEIDDDGTDTGDACELAYGHDLWIGDPGDYTAESNTIDMDRDGFTVADFEYCVDGDTLTLKRLNTDYHDAILTLTRQ